jgi:hypothetical protein
LPWMIGRSVEKTGPILIMQLLSFTMVLAVGAFILITRLSKRSHQ